MSTKKDTKPQFKLQNGKISDLLPPASPEADERLKKSMQLIGVLNPALAIKKGNGELEIIDGKRKLRIGEEEGIEVPLTLLSNTLTEEELTRIRVINSIDWRETSKSDLARHFLKCQESYGLSPAAISRRIEELFGVSISGQTIYNARSEMVEAGEIQLPEKTTGNDGKDRPATLPHRTPKPKKAMVVLHPSANNDASDTDECGRWLSGIGVELSNIDLSELPERDEDMAKHLNDVRSLVFALVDMVQMENATIAKGLGDEIWESVCVLVHADGFRSKRILDIFDRTIGTTWANISMLMKNIRDLTKGTQDHENANNH